MAILATDTFTGRSVSGSWGTASDGNTWSTAAGYPTALNVATGVGTINLSAYSNATMKLGTGSTTDQEGLVKFNLANANDNAGVVLRLDATAQNFYRCVAGAGYILFERYVSGVQGFVGSSSTITTTASTWYWMRFQIIGTTLKGRVWVDGSGEPGTWTITSTDSNITNGGYGLYALPSTISAVSFTSYGVNDTGAILLTAILSDSNSINETVNVLQSNALTDINIITEIVSITSATTLVDNNNITEILNLFLLASSTDTTSVGEVINIQSSATFTDSTAISEMLSLLSLSAMTDSINVQENTSVALRVLLIDSTTIIDTSSAQRPAETIYARVTLVARDGRSRLKAR